MKARGPLVSPARARPFHLADGAAPSARDVECLTDAVYYEARGEGAAGQAAVAQVVLNRVRHPAFPKSICGVVFQGSHTGDGCQFSFTCNGAMSQPREPAAWRRAQAIAEHALDGSVMPSVGNAVNFHAAGVQPGWGAGLMRVVQIGLHVFYRFGGHAGAASSFSRPAEPSADGAATPLFASVMPAPDAAASIPPGVVPDPSVKPAPAQPAEITASAGGRDAPKPAPIAAAPHAEAKPKADAPAAKPETTAAISGPRRPA
jgi:hypothetical protein